MLQNCGTGGDSHGTVTSLHITNQMLTYVKSIFSMYNKGVTVMRLRKLISFVCCLIFIFTFAVSNVYAAASTDESVIDSYLAQAGFSEDIIEILPNDLKNQYLKEKKSVKAAIQHMEYLLMSILLNIL